MSPQVMRNALDLALAQNTGWLSLTLFGGEPLMRPMILETVERVVQDALTAYGRPVQLRWLLDTNGTLLSEPDLDWLAPPRPAQVFVSLDGVPAAHDANRVSPNGQGTHAAVVQGIQRLRIRHIPFDIIAVVSPNSCEYLAEGLAFLLTLGAGCIQFQPNLHAQWNDSSLTRFARIANEAALVWANEFRRGHRVVVEPFHSKVLSHLLSGLRLPPRCQLVTREFAVAPSGRIYPCAEMVGQDDSLDMVVGHVTTGFDPARVSALRQVTQAVHAGCADCALRDRCLNGCGCRQLASTGRLGHVSEALCRLESGWIDAADAAAAQLVDEQCHAFLELYYGSTWSVTGPAPTANDALVQLRSKSHKSK
jgi:uncharacterized protein